MATEKLLHVAHPRECNTQQTERLHATTHATGVQQPTLKALSGAVLVRNNACNSNATASEKARNNTPVLPPPSVASPTLRDRVELEELITVVAKFHAFSDADTQEARTIAIGDIPAALTCFRELARRERQVPAPMIESFVRTARTYAAVTVRVQPMALWQTPIEAIRPSLMFSVAVSTSNGKEIDLSEKAQLDAELQACRNVVYTASTASRNIMNVLSQIYVSSLGTGLEKDLLAVHSAACTLVQYLELSQQASSEQLAIPDAPQSESGKIVH